MPKAVKGVLLQCDPPQMAMILKLNRETNQEYVLEEIDERTCLVRENRVEELKSRVKQIMDQAMGATPEDDIDEDSDLE
ncbi:hypothetical protein BT93_L5590 [Corymbia citriodora subsp. variegata]|uniref:General transcription and DNA repair factor IIH subunit TFB5 n=1 Tax=Corymbia citriodora subsp. variegata TaxID=360336 RepID=A0A8T0CF08_CORYI|nr:hypothetical protein BT93_L5590 [Corymbia citriodora subsp. variegata]